MHLGIYKSTQYKSVIAVVLPALMVLLSLSNASGTTYSAGEGSLANPYQISSSADLVSLSETSSDWGKYFIQTAQINMSLVSNFSPIGNASIAFTGSYDGQGYKIRKLMVDDDGDNVGLFGRVNNAELYRIKLVDIEVSGLNSVGGLVGACAGSNIELCYVSGEVQGEDFIGGLIGRLDKKNDISSSIAEVSVSGTNSIGGFVGYANVNDIISDSYTEGSVGGAKYVGGFIGYNNGARVSNTFSATEILAGKSSVGGHTGYSKKNLEEGSVFDADAAGTAVNDGDAKGLDSEQMQDASLFDSWDLDNIWAFSPDKNNGYPYLILFDDLFLPASSSFIGQGIWYEDHKWSDGKPGEDFSVVIEGNCVLDQKVSVKDVIVDNGALLSVINGGKVNVEGELVLKATSTEHGEYYSDVSGISDTIWQERYFIGGQWTFVSPPVDMKAGEIFPDQQLATSWSDPNANYWMAEYSEAQRAETGSGMKDIFDSEYVLKKGQGYMVWVDKSSLGEYKYVYSANDNAISTDYSQNFALNHSGWNLVGNPFPFTLTYDDIFSCSYNRENFSGAVYVWDGVGYKTFVSGAGDQEASVIKPMEAFFVKRLDTEEETHFCVSKGDCSCTSTQLKSTSTSSAEARALKGSLLTIGVSSNEKTDYTYLRPDNDSNHGIDIGKDAVKFELYNWYQPIVYTRIGEMDFAVNSFPLTDSLIQISLVLNFPQDVETFEVNIALVGNDYNYALLDEELMTLENLEDGQTLTLSTNGETFIHDRYKVVLKKNNDLETGVPTDDESLIEDDVQMAEIIAHREELKIRSLSEDDMQVYIFDLSGVLVNSVLLLSESTYTTVLKSGVYLLKMQSSTSSYSDKILIP